VTQTTDPGDGSVCTDRVTGKCQIVDSTVNQPSNQSPQIQVDSFVYYYVVTALRGSAESGYSMENSGWPNYIASPQGNAIRYDPDNFTDTPCGDMDSALEHKGPDLAQAGEVADEPLHAANPGDIQAPYRTIGTPPVAAPTPNAVPRFAYYHLDHLGTPRVLMDNVGQVISKHHYMPYGEEMPSAIQSSTNKRQFTGHERDPEDGLDYMLARYYSSSLGRFMVVDPIGATLGVPQSLNRYSYVRNNPLGFTDPQGLVANSIGDNPDWMPPGSKGPSGSYVERVTVTAQRPEPSDEDRRASQTQRWMQRMMAGGSRGHNGLARHIPYKEIKQTGETVSQLGQGAQAVGLSIMIVGLVSLQPEIIAWGAAISFSGWVGETESDALVAAVDPREGGPELTGDMAAGAFGAATAPLTAAVAGEFAGPVINEVMSEAAGDAATNAARNCSGHCW